MLRRLRVGSRVSVHRCNRRGAPGGRPGKASVLATKKGTHKGCPYLVLLLSINALAQPLPEERDSLQSLRFALSEQTFRAVGAASGLLYLASEEGAIWVSKDGGKSWDEHALF